jgi:hypothetical protein
MYARYQYNSGATQANILADIVKIFTGETNKANLSASCNQALTVITASVAAGWTVHDAAASSTSQVLKAPYSDNGSAYKYVELKATSTSAFDVFGYETWNATAHTGTNKTGNTSSPQPWTSSSTGFFLLFSSSKFLAIVGQYGTTYGAGSYKGMTIVAEHSREQPWNDGTSYPSFTAIVSTGDCLNGNKQAYFTRVKDTNGYDLTGTSAVTYLVTVGTTYGGWATVGQLPQGVNAKVLDNSGNRYIPMFPIYLFDSSVFSSPVGEISSICDIWVAPKDMLGHLESTTQNGTDYIAVSVHSSGHRFLFRQG